MSQITIIIALLLSLALGGTTPGGTNTVENSVQVDSISLNKADSPESSRSGGGETGWPGF